MSRGRIERLNHAQGADKTIAFADDSFEKDGFFRIVGKSRANFADNIIDAFFGVDKEPGVPEFCRDVFARDELFAAADQKDQQLHGLLLELDAVTGAAKFVAAKVEFKLGNCRFFAWHTGPTLANDAIFISNLRRYRKNTKTIYAVGGRERDGKQS